jgi:hypothetical protein
MDGERVKNKVTYQSKLMFDAPLVRTTFMNLCSGISYRVCELRSGESQLQTYFRRDKTADLSVFVTADMNSICYEHYQSVSDIPATTTTSRQTTTTTNNNWRNIIDENDTNEDGASVIDSCLWICPKRDLTFIGLERCANDR